MSKQPHTRTYYKRSRPLPYYHQKCRTPRHWKFTQDHRTTQPPPPPPPLLLVTLVNANKVSIYFSSITIIYYYYYQFRPSYTRIRGWSGGAMVLGELPVPGRPAYLIYIRARTYYACSRCGWGLFGHFFSRLSFLFSFSLSLGDGPI